MAETTEPTLTTMALTVCSLCAGGTEGECHTPGCAFWMKTAPGVPLTPLGCPCVGTPDEADCPHA
jgi:hypothetical protein